MTPADPERTAALMTPAQLAQLRMQPARGAPAPVPSRGPLDDDAGDAHLRRLAHLRGELQALAGRRDYAGFAAALQALGQCLPQLDFTLLQPQGWIARATGKGKGGASDFVARYDAIMRAMEDVAEQHRLLVRAAQPVTAASERLLADFAQEVRSIEAVIDQGTRWLQDTRSAMASREAGAADVPPQPSVQEEEGARCEALVVRLKQLRATASAAQQAHERIVSAGEKRASTLALLQQALEGEMKAWQVCMRPVAAAAATGEVAAQGVELARTAHGELQAAVQQAVRDCAHLKNNELVIVDQLAELADLAQPLQGA